MAELDDLNAELSDRKMVQKHLLKVYERVKKGFADQQRDRTNDALDNWDCYNCVLNSNQAYEGNSRIYVPIIHDAVEARVTRFTNQVFPTNGKFIDVITENGDIPYAHMALLEDYVRKSKLRTKVIPSLVRNGDMEGQLTVYVTWKEFERTVRYRQRDPMQVGGMEMEGVDDVENVHEEEIEGGCPHVEVIADGDLLILPGTSDTIDDAIENGGSVTIVLRLTEPEIKKYVDDGIFPKDKAEILSKGFSAGGNQVKDTKKELASSAGIKVHQGGKFAMIYQTWSKIKVGGKKKLCVTYFGGDNLILTCKRNPYWCDKCPILSVPVKKIAGVCKGIPPVSSVAKMQYAANDTMNQGNDSATYSLLPIVMTDPEKNPRVGSMVMNLAAVWMTNPNDTQFVNMPALWKDAISLLSFYQSAIFQSLSVNTSMIPGSGKKKQNQAEVAQEQQVDVLTTADYVTTLEEGILTPLAERFYDYDRQFRNENVTVRAYGEMGLRAKMEVAEPIQDNHKWQFRWFGVEQARSTQRIQQQIAAVNVIRGIPPQQYQGRTLDLVPMIENLVLNAFGPTLAPLIFKDERDKLSIDPAVENQMLNGGFQVHTHTLDDDQLHIQSHTQDMQQFGDKSGFLRVHILQHQAQLAAKQQQAGMAAQGGEQGVPGGAGPGVAGTPRPGSVPQGPQQRGVNGAIPPDQMRDPSAMPRRM